MGHALDGQVILRGHGQLGKGISPVCYLRGARQGYSPSEPQCATLAIVHGSTYPPCPFGRLSPAGVWTQWSFSMEIQTGHLPPPPEAPRAFPPHTCQGWVSVTSGRPPESRPPATAVPPVLVCSDPAVSTSQIYGKVSIPAKGKLFSCLCQGEKSRAKAR